MKKAQQQLRADLADGLQTRLSGLNQQHAKKLRKTVLGAVAKLARKFRKLMRKEFEVREKAHRHATRASVKELVFKLHTALARPHGAAAHRRRPAHTRRDAALA